MEDRRIRNRSVACDFCGRVTGWLYVTARHSGVFCRGCVETVLNPVPVQRVSDDDAGWVGIGQKINTYLKTVPESRVFCGTGKRGRPRKDTALREC